MEKLQNIINNLVAGSIGDVVHPTCDVVGADFVSHRFPPKSMLNQNRNKNNNKSRNKEIEVNDTTKVCLKSPDWIRAVNDSDIDDEESDVDEDEDEDENMDNDDGYMYKDKSTKIGVKMVDVKSMDNGSNDKVDSFLDDSDDDIKDENDDQDTDTKNGMNQMKMKLKTKMKGDLDYILVFIITSICIV